MNRIINFVALVLIASGFSCAQNKSAASEDIRLNQIGFYPQGPKLAVIVNAQQSDFYITAVDTNKKLLEGKLSEQRQSPFSKKTRLADFSSFTQPGTFVLVVPGVGQSHPFEIKPHVYAAVAKGVIKAYYYQRASTSIPEVYGNKWGRAAGHPDNKITIHPSAVSVKRPEGSAISAPRGWYDAGDYNKYIVNSGITMGTLLSAYEDFPEYFKKQKLNIPETSNNVPDLLDEILWNLRWMLSMQDPEDGGVYNKLTNASFDKMIMPDKATTQRYVVQKGTAATLDFAAVTAQAARIFKTYETEFPGLYDSCLAASKAAWQWAVKYPAVQYDQDAMNKKFKPVISTGGYGDNNFSDEFLWAACELYITTQQDDYYHTIHQYNKEFLTIPSWNQLAMLGYYTLFRNEKNVSSIARNDIAELKNKFLIFSSTLIDGAAQSTYATVMGKTGRDFIWGSNSVAANQGIALLQAYRLSGNKEFLHYALGNIDYLLGRNGTGYSFITGFGNKPPMHPHHRPSEADGVEEPVPGWLVGGPNLGMQDRCSYPSQVADEAYVDASCSYASNEIAINWNAPAVYLLCAAEAINAR